MLLILDLFERLDNFEPVQLLQVSNLFYKFWCLKVKDKQTELRNSAFYLQPFGRVALLD